MKTNISKQSMISDLSAKMPSKTAMLIALGSVGAVTALGVGAAAVYNSRQMKTARALKRTGRIMYTVGTTMRDISGAIDG